LLAGYRKRWMIRKVQNNGTSLMFGDIARLNKNTGSRK
jgi:hypothetical protein